jgi:UDP-2,4-diacetamido-2,4,6-trideoxy-beta-L-altropyranose hydrolase
VRPVKVAFRCDVSAAIGSGHVMRCLTLADELKSRGAECLFLLGGDAASPGAGRIAERGHSLHLLAALLDSHDIDAERHDATVTLRKIADLTLDWVVVDHYQLGERWELAIRRLTKRVLVLDDLANRRHEADILVDPTVGRDPASYGQLVGDACQTLIGGAYALLRPEFMNRRVGALRSRDPAHRIHLAFGGGRWPTEAWSLLLALAARYPEAAICVNLASLEGVPDAVLARSGQIELKLTSPDVAGDMAACTVSIGAPGSMTWERFCLGLPFACVTTHPTQVEPVSLLARGGYLADLGPLRAPDTALMSGIESFLADQAQLDAFSAKGRAAVDGKGCQRVADAMLEGP